MNNKYSTLKILALHLYPGILITLLYGLFTPIVNDFGFPSLFSLMTVFVIVIVPTELCYLLVQGKKNYGKYTLVGISDTEFIPRGKFITIIAVAIVSAIIVAGVTMLIDQSLKTKLFSWLPAWYFYDSEFDQMAYAKNILIITAVMRIFVDGLIIPITEELYFRGYLLPRIKGRGIQVPIYATILFAIYHFWQPWNYLSLIVIAAILVIPAWYYKNYKLSVYIHTIINTVGAVLFLLMLLQR